jgi:NAD(P)-dependent dehydrogenase (short-subunit alcohol dehydrogenase family)
MLHVVLINNAGYLEANRRIQEADADDWWKTYEVNMKGTFLPTREALRIALARPERPVNLAIINTSSMGSAGTRLGFSAYAPGKSAVNRFTEFIHFEYEEEGVRTFAYHPGESWYLSRERLTHNSSGGILTKLALDSMPLDTHHLLGDTPELAAGFSLWLATSGSKVDFLRGRYSAANWDVEELLDKKQEIEKGNLLWTRVVGQEQVHEDKS